jgi:hypothetical protein
VDLYIHSSIRLHGVVLNFSTGTTLPFISNILGGKPKGKETLEHLDIGK